MSVSRLLKNEVNRFSALDSALAKKSVADGICGLTDSAVVQREC